MAHPDLLAKLLRASLPPQPGESGASFEAERLPLVEPRTGHEAAKRVCVDPVNAVRYFVRGHDEAMQAICHEHRFVGFCPECHNRRIRRGTLEAVAGRMFQGAGR